MRSKLPGLTPQQNNSTLDDIAEFEELGDYLHIPIRTYSAAMLVCVALAVINAPARLAVMDVRTNS